VRRVRPSVIVREELDRLLAEGADQETNTTSCPTCCASSARSQKSKNGD
jgi:hypothetical protein